MAQYLAQNWWYVLLVGICLAAVVVLVLRQAAKESDEQKCREDCIVNEDEYCDCGGWPITEPPRSAN